MKKRMLTGLLQYIGAFVLVLASVLTVYAFDSGRLPFMDDDYLNARAQAGSGTPLPEINGEAGSSSKPQQTVTAATFISSLFKADSDTKPYTGTYNSDNCVLVNRSISELGVIGNGRLELRCGFIIKTENDRVVSIHDSSLKDVSTAVNGWTLTYLRSADGRPLFTNNGKHAYFENGNLVNYDYDAVNLDKGVYSEYTFYPMGYDTGYTVYKEGGFYGMKKADGTVITKAEYVDVYGVSEGHFVAVDADKRLHLFTASGALVSDEYYAAEKDDVNAVGYYFVKNGMTRARTGDGTEVLLRTDGTVLSVPSGFSVCAYSDGVILLNGASGYGYMNSRGRWISSPDYKQALPFSEGLAVVCDHNGNYGVISLNGTVVVPCVFTSITGSFDGVILAYAQDYGYYIINKVQTPA